jgi:hypothetical protein
MDEPDDGEDDDESEAGADEETQRSPGRLQTSASEAALPTAAVSETVELAGLPVAPEYQRVDLAEPSFSDPTHVTNPLNPIGLLHSALLLGTENGLPLRVETTLLPNPKTISINGQQIEALESQYVAYLDGRILEVALDWYAQADDGAVWYLGEDVFNYEDGVVVDTEGTWLAGRDGPPAMIMPGKPQIGDVYRPENIPGLVFEEVTVKSTGQAVYGPQGRVDGAIIVEELHMDGSYEEKIFAPGYGEFLTGAGGDLEALSLAVPTDVLSGYVPAELAIVVSKAVVLFDAAQARDWRTAPATLDTLLTAWGAYRMSDLPLMLDAQMSHALVKLVAAVNARQPSEAGHAAIDVAQAGLDLQLRYRLPVEIDLARFGLWVAQILLDAADGERSAVTGDVAVLEWILARFKHTLARTEARKIDALLGALRTAADEEDLAAAAAAAGQLRTLLDELDPAD